MFAVSQPISNMNFKYDADHDVLHLTFGLPEVSYVDELAPDIFVRYSDKNDAITGAIILDFSLKNNHELDAFPLRVNFEEIRRKLNI